MTTQETPNDLPIEETPEETKKFAFKPLAKKALVWGGAAVGVIAVALIAASSRRIAETLEDDTIVIQEIPNGYEVVEAQPETTTD